MQLLSFIKKLTILNAIFGIRASKTAGVRDRSNFFKNGPISFDSVTNSITCQTVTSVPVWMSAGKYLVANFTGFEPNLPPSLPGPEPMPNILTNHYVKYKIKRAYIQTNNLIIELDSSTPIINSTPAADGSLDGRIWAVTNSYGICRAGAYYDTIFNVHNQVSDGTDDGSGIAQAQSEHFHPAIPPTPETTKVSPAFAFGREGPISPGTFLLNQGVPSNINGIIIEVTNGIIVKFTIESGSSSTCSVSLVRKNGLTFDILYTGSLVAERYKVFNTNIAVSENDEVSVRLDSGIANNSLNCTFTLKEA